MNRSQQVAQLNEECLCSPLHRETFVDHLTAKLPALEASLKTREHMFASTGVLTSQGTVDSMIDVINAVEALVALPDYQSHIYSRTNTEPYWQEATTRGLLLGYDFHITHEGPRLIEINTNAGGAFLSAEIQKAASHVFPGCCDFHPLSFQPNHATSQTAAVGTDLLKGMELASVIVDEWQFAGKKQKPNTVAIVDDNPAAQYLLPDMLLAQQSLNTLGVKSLLVDVEALEFDGVHLTSNGVIIDMVYNRTTDFSLTSLKNKSLIQAAKNDAVVVSPSPKHHALYADKHNLIDMGDDVFLREVGLQTSHINVLRQHLPTTTLVTQENAEQHFENRRNLFFKPVHGYGSKAVYRGDKVTKRVWQHIINNAYVAQTRIPPALRVVKANDVQCNLKFDFRIFTAAGQPLIAIARIYNGQTTNFRTIGGGFAPVYNWGEQTLAEVS